MKFRILGPLEISHQGHAVTVGAARQRAVLTSLLLQANHTVSVDLLVDQVWGERPPDSAEATLRTYVSRLRKVMGDTALVTTSAGYLLQVGAGELDLHRFHDLVAHARRNRLDRPEQAAVLLGEALTLWRGPALADLVPTPSWECEAVRLEELRMSALDDLFNAKLRCGRHTEIIAELYRLHGRYPLRERVAAQLMLALHGAGRRIDALTVYQAARRNLAHELGLDPSHDLQRAHRLVLEDARPFPVP